MKLLVIRPVIPTPRLHELTGELGGDELARLCGSTAGIEISYLPFGPASVECEYDDVAAAAGVCHVVAGRAKEVDGILVDCFVDPGVDAARELAPGVPVLGAGEASLACAALLGDRVSVITVVEPVARMIERRARRHGMQGHLARARWVDVPVLATTDRKRLVRLICGQAAEAVEQEGADVILLGCTGFRGLAREVGVGLNAMRARQVPVLDPTVTALKMLESLAALGLTQSGIAFAPPPQKPRTFS